MSILHNLYSPMVHKLFRKIHPKEPLRNLHWIDVIIVTLILFGRFIMTSTQTLIYNLTVTQTATDSSSSVVFTDADNWSALFLQSKFLFAAFLYLVIRHFDFKQFKDKMRFEWKLIPWFIFIHVIASFAMDIQYYNVGLFQLDWTLENFIPILTTSSVSLVIYSLLNGFYEEFYFLGLLLSTDKKYRVAILIFSTIVRISFHTYVNLPFALSIGVIFGLIYNYLYIKKYNNLLAFCLAHALCDIYGIGVIYFFI